MNDHVLILDFGSQYTQLIARRVREAGVYSEIVPFQSAEKAFKEIQPKAVILSGGPSSTTDEGSPRVPEVIFESRVPVLGICYGQMALCLHFGGKAEPGSHREFGRSNINVDKNCPLFDGVWSVGEQHQVWMSHGDRVNELPNGFEVFAHSEAAPFAVLGNPELACFGLMFHPEVVHTPDGAKILENFVMKVAGCSGDWNMAAFKDIEIKKIQEQVGKSNVICGLSGGVDSAVAAVLIHEAVGEQLTCIFVDHGLLRLDEASEVAAMFKSHYNIPLVHVDARNMFIKALEGISDPEKKAKNDRQTVY